jgi:hypothetical protein
LAFVAPASAVSQVTTNKRSDETSWAIVVYGRLQEDERSFQKRFWQALGDAKFTADGKSDKKMPRH